MAADKRSVDPRKFSDERFELYSIPAFDTGVPELLYGREIGSNKQIVQPGDVLLSKIVPHIRRTWIVLGGSGHQAIASSEWIIFRNPAFDPAYLRQALTSDRFHREFMRTVAGVGGSLLRARPAQVADIEVPLPPIEEQRRIATVLDQADKLRAKRRATLALLDSLTESIFLDMLGSKPWPLVAIESLAADRPHAIRTGPFGSQLLHSEFVDEGIAVLGIDNAVQDRFAWGRPRFITEQKFEQLRRYQVHPGDVLVTIMGTCGRCAVVPDDVPTAISTKHLCCITLDQQRCTPTFLWATLKYHSGVRRQLGASARGAVMPGLNLDVSCDCLGAGGWLHR
ncbi:MAG: hypothetical protein GEU78_17970, partial [Actinobacteria bacterium]|nr:hypothetical protein [Actinomycetota bacterium]